MPTLAPIEAGAHVEWAGFLSGHPVFATAGGEVVIVAGGERRLAVPGGLTLAAPSRDGRLLVTGGEDGAVRTIAPDGTLATLREPVGRWADALACGPDGSAAVACGRTVEVVDAAGRSLRRFEAARSAEGLAFAPKGMRLAVARYNGVELVFAALGSPPQELEWKGAHVGVVYSPDGAFLVTAMQENALHGWRLADAKHMRMTGYPAKVRSMSFSARGRWLASSGAPGAILWPFQGRDGPMGKGPKELASMGKAMVTRVACHPVEQVVAVGYETGMVTLAQIDDGRVVVLRREGGGPVSALGWDAGGARLAFGCEDGSAGIVTLAD